MATGRRTRPEDRPYPVAERRKALAANRVWERKHLPGEPRHPRNYQSFRGRPRGAGCRGARSRRCFDSIRPGGPSL